MTAPLRSTPRPSALPASQTAPVAEFRCLFTHDVKRKQKRWQDGYLKFHTFNSRVMVYDQSRNHVGDTYWKESNELQEGDELSLDRGVMVEVAEAMGVTQTDLTPLFEKKPKEQTTEPPARATPASVAARPYQRPSSVAPVQAPRGGSQLRHKSLNTLLGTPKGPIGKAVPIKSPFEKKRDQENEEAVGRAAKRQRIVPPPPTWRASSPIDQPSSPNSPIFVAEKPVAPRRVAAPQVRPPSTFTLPTLSSEPDIQPANTSDTILPSPPPANNQRTKKPPIPPPSKTTPKVARNAAVSKAAKAKSPMPPAPPSSPPVSASNRLENVDVAIQPSKKYVEKPAPPVSPPRNPKARSLRLSAGVRRGTLLCQSLPQSGIRVPRERSISQSSARPAPKRVSPVSNTNIISDASPPHKTKRKSPPVDARSKGKKSKVAKAPTEIQEDSAEDPEIVHGLMDQQLLVLSSPVEERPQFRHSRHTGLDQNTVHPAKTKPSSDTRRRNNSVPSNAAPIPTFQPPLTASREVSPAYTEASDARSRTGSTSPTKALFSAGGFRKKQKISKQSAAEVMPEVPTPARRNESVILPPHPLEPKRKGPQMTTTRLSSLLRKSKNKLRTDDPIEEEDAQPAGKSPNRSFRRVRSENDAPIPSTAQDWEKRNLPKTSSDLTEPEPAASKAPTTGVLKSKSGGLAALVKKTDPRNKFQRTKSLTIETSMTSPVVEPELPSPVIDKDVGPWSTEAFDLFDWRPPNRDDGEAIM